MGIPPWGPRRLLGEEGLGGSATRSRSSCRTGLAASRSSAAPRGHRRPRPVRLVASPTGQGSCSVTRQHRLQRRDGSESVHSPADVDLLVIGRLDRVTLSELLAPVQRTIGRDVNVVTKTEAQLRERRYVLATSPAETDGPTWPAARSPSSGAQPKTPGDGPSEWSSSWSSEAHRRRLRCWPMRVAHWTHIRQLSEECPSPGMGWNDAGM